jgi:NAD(P)-dependent dehydrogenase (short-subunit alcohol dehydrogenase family)
MSQAINDTRLPSADAGIVNPPSDGTAVITGASSGIGAIYADRLAHRGHDLILVARNRERLDALATRLTEETGRSVQVLVADLHSTADLARVEQVLRTDATITMLVNNAGGGSADVVAGLGYRQIGPNDRRQRHRSRASHLCDRAGLREPRQWGDHQPGIDRRHHPPRC